MATCAYCKSISSVGINGDLYKIECPRCGTYSITLSAIESLRTDTDPKTKANASGWIRDNQGIVITSDNKDLPLTAFTPSVAERGDRLLQLLAQDTLALGASVNYANNQHYLGKTYSRPGEVEYLARSYLGDQESLVELNPNGSCTITPKGYAHLESLRQVNPNSQLGFCAMWFDTQMYPIWENAILPAITNARYEGIRIDGHPHNNRIDDEIIAMIRKSKFMVADFTGQRGGVYFEAGFALGLGIPVIWTCNKQDMSNIHFDNRQYNFIFWEEDNLPKFTRELQARIEATLGQGSYKGNRA